MNRIAATSLFASILLSAAMPSAGQDFSRIPVRDTPLAGNVHMLSGAGGNIALLAGDEGSLLVDADYNEMGEKLAAAVKEINDKPVRFVINTHWHFDHVGGNERLAKAGATIIAHEMVRQRMTEERDLAGLDRHTGPSPTAALPIVTFTDAVTLHLNGETVEARHFNAGHTDGDCIVYFHNANVMHVGDLYFHQMYPFFDVNAGGSLDGMIEAIDHALTWANKDTKIIPGHGPLLSVDELHTYRNMLAANRDRIRKLVAQGKSREETIAAAPTKETDAQFGQSWMTPTTWVGLVYDAMKKTPVAKESPADKETPTSEKKIPAKKRSAKAKASAG